MAVEHRFFTFVIFKIWGDMRQSQKASSCRQTWTRNRTERKVREGPEARRQKKKMEKHVRSVWAKQLRLMGRQPRKGARRGHWWRPRAWALWRPS